MKKEAGFRLVALAIVIAFLMLGQNSFAQGSKTSFSGKWAFNESKSNLGSGGGGFQRGGGDMSVNQDGNNLTVERTRTNQNGETVTTTEKFTLDGKESVNTPAGGRGGPGKAVVKWSADGKALNFAITRTFSRDGQTTEMKSTETWTLTSASTLSVASTASTPNGEMKTTRVYDKK